eukprot:gene24842-biopygen10470
MPENPQERRRPSPGPDRLEGGLPPPRKLGNLGICGDGGGRGSPPASYMLRDSSRIEMRGHTASAEVSRSLRRARRTQDATRLQAGTGGVRWGGREIRDFPGWFPARKSAPRAARPSPRGARSGGAQGADGTRGWSSFPTTLPKSE